MLLKNFLANAATQLLYPVLSFVLVPFYLHHLGAEGYGLIGFYALLVSLLGVFTKGVGTALLREISRRDVSQHQRGTLRRLVRTFEAVYWAAGVAVAAVLLPLSGVISSRWVHVETTPPGVVRICLILLSSRIALALPNVVYQTVFIGMQRQVLGNVLSAISVLAGAASTVAAVLVWKSVVAYCAIDVVAACSSLVLFRYCVNKRVLPPRDFSVVASFDVGEIRALWRLSLGLIWVNGVSIIITQLDRLFISRLLPIANLGMYSIGAAGGILLTMACSPFFIAVYPTTCQVASRGDKSELGEHLMRNAKVILVLTLAIGLPISFFAKDIVRLWVRDERIVGTSSAVMAIYVLGSMLLSNANVFYVGQKALGNLRYMTLSNAAALLWYPGALWLMVRKAGVAGAAWVWVGYCGLELAIGIVVTFFVLVKGLSLAKHLGVMTGCGVVSAGLILGARQFATLYFPDWIWGRVMFGGIASVAILGAGYLMCFGLRLPQDLLIDVEREGIR